MRIEEYEFSEDLEKIRKELQEKCEFLGISKHTPNQLLFRYKHYRISIVDPNPVNREFHIYSTESIDWLQLFLSTHYRVEFESAGKFIDLDLDVMWEIIDKYVNHEGHDET